MQLSRRMVGGKSRWFLGDNALPSAWKLDSILSLSRAQILDELTERAQGSEQSEDYLSPVEGTQEVWAAGVTYLRSRVEREAESTVADVYAKVYEADRPELFFKTLGWRTVGHRAKIRIRKDSPWNVPEPELTLVVNSHSEIIGYTAGNDVSSRSIEGENPLYLPQAKSYDQSCAVGATIIIAAEEELVNLPIQISIVRQGQVVFSGEANTSQMKRTFRDLVDYLFRETAFPNGVFLMTGTGIVPTAEFTLLPGDIVSIQVGEVHLVNEVTDEGR